MKQHEHAAANDNRPAEFDAMVMAYVPGLRNMARRMTRDWASADELVTDTIILALTKWRNLREDGGIWAWLTWEMRRAMSSKRQKEKSGMRAGTLVNIDSIEPPYLNAHQHQHSVLQDVTRRLSDIRNGDVVLRVAMGDTMADIARERGLSRERVRKIHAEALRKLEAA